MLINSGVSNQTVNAPISSRLVELGSQLTSSQQARIDGMELYARLAVKNEVVEDQENQQNAVNVEEEDGKLLFEKPLLLEHQDVFFSDEINIYLDVVLLSDDGTGKMVPAKPSDNPE